MKLEINENERSTLISALNYYKRLKAFNQDYTTTEILIELLKKLKKGENDDRH